MLSGLILPQNSYAVDWMSEHSNAMSYSADLINEELVELNTFPIVTSAIYLESTRTDAQGATIIIPDVGDHANQTGWLSSLRHDLTQYGWSTLSLPAPILDSTASPSELEIYWNAGTDRLRTAVNFLNQKGIQNIVLIGHGLGASLAVSFVTLSERANISVQAIVAISWPDSGLQKHWQDSATQVSQLKLPLLDVYAEIDQKSVHMGLPKRLHAAHLAGQFHKKPPDTAHSSKVRQLAKRKTGNLRYRQVMIPSTGHQFVLGSDTLNKIIRGWINIYAAGIRATIVE